MKYLIDTCVWRDFYEGRVSKTGNPIGHHAYNLFQKILNNGVILYSKYLIHELKIDYSKEDINDWLGFLLISGNLLMVQMDQKQHKEARKLSAQRDLPYVDCLNAVLARDNDAVLISQDKHFEKLKDICDFKRPQEII